jgi:arylsulfatase A-like enzyme
MFGGTYDIRRSLLRVGLMISGLVLMDVLPPARAAVSRPNIVLIVADDLGFSDVGCYGGEIATPNLDRLAAEGLRMTQFYNCAVCNPSRAGIHTGLYPRFPAGGRLRQDVLLRDDMVTLAEVLRGAGYATAMSGKWHLPGHPMDCGFDEYYGVIAGAVDYFDPLRADPPGLDHRRGDSYFFSNREVIRQVPGDFYLTDALTQHAEQQLRQLAQADRPFFLHVAYTAPHYPLQARPQDIERYRGRYKDGYAAIRRRRFERLRETGLIRAEWSLPDPDRKLGPWRYDLEPQPWQDLADVSWETAKMEVYAAMVDVMDRGIGRLLSAIESSGAAQNTLVIFFSDNGGCASDALPQAYADFRRGIPAGSKDSYLLPGPGWATAQSSPFRRYKTSTYEGGISTPMIVRWPARIPRRGKSDAVGHVVDLMPTFVELAGAVYPSVRGIQTVRPMEGESLVPAWLSSRENERELGWYAYGSRAYRAGRWKAVWGVTGSNWELYNMDQDRTETRNVASSHPEVLRRLVAGWSEWAKRTELPAE